MSGAASMNRQVASVSLSSLSGSGYQGTPPTPAPEGFRHSPGGARRDAAGDAKSSTQLLGALFEESRESEQHECQRSIHEHGVDEVLLHAGDAGGASVPIRQGVAFRWRRRAGACGAQGVARSMRPPYSGSTGDNASPCSRPTIHLRTAPGGHTRWRPSVGAVKASGNQSGADHMTRSSDSQTT